MVFHSDKTRLLCSAETCHISSLISAATTFIITIPSLSSKTIATTLIIAVIALLTTAYISPSATERGPEAEEHADAECYDAYPEPWILELLCLCLDLFLRCCLFGGAIIVAVHSWMMHKGFT